MSARYMALVWLVAASVAAGTTLDRVRVHSVQQEVFAYRFTSVVSSREPVTLAFNHMDGRTVFARVGEAVGDYTLQSFSAEGRERAMLVGADGESYLLKLGIPLSQPGHVACLVSMANGGWIYAGDGAQFSLAAAQARVDRMLAGAVLPQANSQPVAEPPVKVGRRAGFFVGTEYRYPVAYDVIPVVTRGRDGRMTLRGMPVPTRFTTRRTGIGVSVR